MAETSNNISWSEREEYFADYFRSLRLENRKQVDATEDEVTPVSNLSFWKRFRYFHKSEHKDIRAIAEAVAGEDTDYRRGYNIAKSAGVFDSEYDGGKKVPAPKSMPNPGSKGKGAAGVADQVPKIAGSMPSLGASILKFLGMEGDNAVLNIIIRELIDYLIWPTLALIGKVSLYVLPILAILVILLTAASRLGFLRLAFILL